MEELDPGDNPELHNTMANSPDGGFEDFIEREGFVALWRETGDWGDFCRPVSESEIECN